MTYYFYQKTLIKLIMDQILGLVHGSGPFDRPQSDTPTLSDEKHLARIISILGPPPVDMLLQAKDGF